MFDKITPFRLTLADVSSSNKERGAVKEIAIKYIKENPTIADFEVVKKEIHDLIKNTILQKDTRRDAVVQIIGDGDRNAYVDIYIVDKKNNTHSRTYSSPISIEDLWKRYNQALSNIFEKEIFPAADISRGYDWFKEEQMQLIQRELLDFCHTHSSELIRISSDEQDPRIRGIANMFLRFVNNAIGVKALLKATEDEDHFAHNMAWQSIGVKLPYLLNTHQKEFLEEIMQKAFVLLDHPSSICRNKALLTIYFYIDNNISPRFPEGIYKKIVAASTSLNPMISNPAKSIIKITTTSG